MGIREDTTELLAPAEPAAQPPHGSLIGRTLGKFTMVSELGRGGSGEVYRAEETELGRSVVIKVLRRDVARKPNRVERFLREVKLASRLDHPYAAHVYAFGAEADGVVWIAMEHVKGMTLDTLVALRGAMPPSLFAPLFERLCEVVHTAHELGIVHRDIKGSNVMVVERAGKLLPKLLDFGIAKGIAGPTSPGADDDELTGHGAILGSPHYMAPEQWTSAADVDARADIYALGVLAYFCLAGKVPFAGIDRHGLPQAHRERVPRALPSTVPESAARAVERALAKSPDARWPDALAFGAAVRAAVGVSAPEVVPLLDPTTRDAWTSRGPQPIADAIARLARATTTVDADAALYELIAITCRWCATVALAQLREPARMEVREHARAVIDRDEATPWLALARVAAAHVPPAIAGLDAALAATSVLERIATRLDDRDRARTAAALAADVAALPEALKPLAPLLDYQLVVGRADSAESWQGVRRRDRERVVVWGEPLANGEVALLDAQARVVTRLTPLVQVYEPLPSAEPELFLLWRTMRGGARLVAAPWGYERDDEEAARWLAVMTTADSEGPTENEQARSPYPGLAAYATEDADHFVGREREVEALLNRLVAAPMVAVLGASGAGKTSFVHAGVLPRLAEGYATLSLRPGRHPLRALSALLLDTEDTNDDDALVAELRRRGERAMRGLVVVVDQLEELVTLCSDADERDRFAAVLAQAASAREAPLRVVVTLRDDFANIVEAVPAFRGRFELFVLATPAPDALRRIITEPARRAQVAIDPVVVDDMVLAVEGRAGSLPLLSFTGAQLWQTRDRDGKRITREAYEALGGVAGALSTYADQVHDSFTARDQERVRVLFSRLVAADGTRIPIPRVELEALPGADAVLPRLIDARLLVVREDAGVDVVEIVHECLATRWERLARWRSEDAAERVLLADLRVAARRWNAGARDPDLLWRGEALRELRRLAARSQALTGTEREFATESDRRVLRQRRARRVLAVGTMITLAAIAATMGYLRVVADRNRGAAERSAQDARTAAKLAEDRLTASLIAQGRRELNQGQGLAALAYFGEVLQRGHDTLGLRLMIGAAARAWQDELFVAVRGGYTATELVATGFMAARDGRVFWWSEDARPIGELALTIGTVHRLLVQGDRMLALGTRGIAVLDVAKPVQYHSIETNQQLMDAALGPGPDELSVAFPHALVVYALDGAERRRVALPPLEHFPLFTHDAARALLGTSGTIIAIDMRTLAQRKLVDGNKYGPGGSRDRKVFAYLTHDDVVGVLDATGKVRYSFRAENQPIFATLSEHGELVAAVGSTFVDVRDERGPRWRATLEEGAQEAGSVRLLPDGMWTASLDGILRRYQNSMLIASLPSHLGKLLEMKASSRLIVTRSEDTSLVVVRATTSHIDREPIPCIPEQLDATALVVGLMCGKAVHVYIGRQHVGTLGEGERMFDAAFDPGSKRTVIATARELHVFEGKQRIAVTDARIGRVAFADRDHVLVAEPETATGKPGLWRWAFATSQWQRVRDIEPGTASIAAQGSTLLLADANHLRFVTGTEQARVVDLPAPIESIMFTPTGQISAQLITGQLMLLDGNGKVVRELAPVDASEVHPAFDKTGTLIVRPQLGAFGVWDATTGDNLLDDLDLFRYAGTARFTDDDRLEFAGSDVGTLRIAPDRRPRDEILRSIECRVPLKISGSRLEAREVKCR